jgi:hypothetical protein
VASEDVHQELPSSWRDPDGPWSETNPRPDWLENFDEIEERRQKRIEAFYGPRKEASPKPKRPIPEGWRLSTPESRKADGTHKFKPKFVNPELVRPGREFPEIFVTAYGDAMIVNKESDVIGYWKDADRDRLIQTCIGFVESHTWPDTGHEPNSAVFPAVEGEGAPKHPDECQRCGLGRIKPFKDQTERCRGKHGGDIAPAGRLRVTFKEHADWHKDDDKQKTLLKAAMDERNAAPFVLAHQPTEEACDALSPIAEANPAVLLPTYAPSVGMLVKLTNREKQIHELPAPTAEELLQHKRRFTSNESPKAKTELEVVLVQNAYKVKAARRAGSKRVLPARRRRSSQELVSQVLEMHSRNVLPAAIADALNVSDRRVRSIVAASTQK